MSQHDQIPDLNQEQNRALLKKIYSDLVSAGLVHAENQSAKEIFAKILSGEFKESDSAEARENRISKLIDTFYNAPEDKKERILSDLENLGVTPIALKEDESYDSFDLNRHYIVNKSLITPPGKILNTVAKVRKMGFSYYDKTGMEKIESPAEIDVYI
jgi:hypothetical protein